MCSRRRSAARAECGPYVAGAACMIRVFLVGDVRLNREGLASLLGRDSRLHVTGHAAAGDGVLFRDVSVDIVIS